MLVFKLNQQIDCNRLCGAIQQEIIKASQQNVNIGNCVLTIEIKTIIDSQDNSMIPKLTYQKEPLTN